MFHIYSNISKSTADDVTQIKDQRQFNVPKFWDNGQGGVLIVLYIT